MTFIKRHLIMVRKRLFIVMMYQIGNLKLGLAVVATGVNILQ